MKPFDIEIAATIGSESRALDIKPTSLDQAVRFATAYVSKNRGTKAVVNIKVPQAAGLYDYNFALFEISYPKLDDWMLAAVEQHYGRRP